MAMTFIDLYQGLMENNVPSLEEAAEDQTLSLADVSDDIPHEKISDTDTPPHQDNHQTQSSRDSRPHRLENTLKPS